MKKYGSYLVCKEHVNEVRDFLAQFFKEERDKYNHKGWVTFKIPESDFKINLMEGKDQEMTQNMTFEIYCGSMEELKQYSERFNLNIDSFTVTETEKNYRYSYIEVFEPNNICKVEISYSADL